jgi:hypothetical protein
MMRTLGVNSLVTQTRSERHPVKTSISPAALIVLAGIQRHTYHDSEKARRRTSASAERSGVSSFADAAHDLVFRQHGELVNSDRRSYVQTSIPPLAEGEVEFRISLLGGNGRSDEIVVSGIEKNYGWTHFAARRLVKFDPNQDYFTRSKGSHLKGHGSTARKQSPQERKPIQTDAALPRAIDFLPHLRPTPVQPQPSLQAELATQFQAEPQSDRLVLSLPESRQFSSRFFLAISSHV